MSIVVFEDLLEFDPATGQVGPHWIWCQVVTEKSGFSSERATRPAVWFQSSTDGDNWTETDLTEIDDVASRVSSDPRWVTRSGRVIRLRMRFDGPGGHGARVHVTVRKTPPSAAIAAGCSPC